jgi:two-component system, OmpR family, phosphate regulon response regulator OmpR
MYHLLVVDDDPPIRLLLAEFLINQGFFLSTAADTKSAEALMKIFRFDLIILDIMMPQESGTDFLARLAGNHPPVIMLTAMADVDDRINGLELGAQDYLAKPFEVKELLLRINNLLNRSKGYAKSIIKFGDHTFDLNNGLLFYQKEQVHLTNTEVNLLTLLLKNPGEVVTRDFLASAAVACDINERAIDAQIARLRAKIEKSPKNPMYLHTIRNKGYVFRLVDRP